MEETRPTLRELALVVNEAELWLARCRLMRAGQAAPGALARDRPRRNRAASGLTATRPATIHRRSSRGAAMRVRNSLRAAKARDKNCRVVRRRGRVYVINKKNPRMKARQG